ncbi:AI-2E family transporter [Fulvivirga ulvae]|uniref:AI-2E family transporter n=1 Tax=Fulvivirga ulvae TaxID=2904245 RepID=UPI001F34ACB9|nr:AI-2E family transporter [Fulvivirga ulvae]UII30278.1 AI-2E family transporter [Fulvivirga ulvae]
MKTSDVDSRMSFSIRQLFFALSSVLGIIALLHLGRTAIVPLAFALLISFILYPICSYLEKLGTGRMWAIVWTILGVVLLIFGIAFLFSTQIINIVREFDDFKEKLNDVVAGVTNFLNNKISLIPELNEESLREMSQRWFSDKSGGLVTNTLNNTALFLTGITLTIIYTFLLLLYRRGLKKAFVNFAAEDKREQYASMIDNMQRVGQKYLTGMFILIMVLGVLNSCGLLLIGIDYAFFFGFLAAFLAIVPYVGTTLGGAIPALYAFMNYESYWYPAGVILMFWFIQVLEGNFLNPKIVGGNLNLNALVAIMALISGGLVWGIPGMILFLPYMAIFKVACEHYKELSPISYVLKDDLYKKHDKETAVERKIKKIFKK